jgi:glycosyltransferase involved in cell wall biosynthesis
VNDLPKIDRHDEPSFNDESKYVLVTAAYNEEANIGKTIEAVVSQTSLPKRWIIVSDGSIDRTDEIVQEYSKKYSFIRSLRIARRPGRSFGSKVRAFRAGAALLADITYDFIGNLDADVTLADSYFTELIVHFDRRPSLGVAGGFVVEELNGKFQNRRQNRVYSIAHAGQLVRRECYDAIGGYAVLEYGGEDWHAQTCAKMKGWEVEAFPHLKVFHHRRTGEAENLLRHKFRQGRMDFSFGSDTIFEILKCMLRITEKPFLLGGTVRLFGFFWSMVCNDKRPVTPEFIEFLRQEQRQKLSSMFAHPRKFFEIRNQP